jgi:hypothetical protein
VIDPPDGFDAVIEDRYAVVAGHYHDVLIFRGAGRAFGCKSAGSLSGAGLRIGGDGPSVVLLEGSEYVASRLVASDDHGHSTRPEGRRVRSSGSFRWWFSPVGVD